MIKLSWHWLKTRGLIQLVHTLLKNYSRLTPVWWNEIFISWGTTQECNMQSEWMCEKRTRSELCECHLVLSYICMNVRNKNREKTDITIIFMNSKKNQVNTWFERNTREKSGITCCWVDQEPSSAQLYNLEQYSPFIWKLKYEIIEGISCYICYLVDEDWVHCKKRQFLPLVRCIGCLLWSCFPYNENKM